MEGANDMGMGSKNMPGETTENCTMILTIDLVRLQLAGDSLDAPGSEYPPEAR